MIDIDTDIDVFHIHSIDLSGIVDWSTDSKYIQLLSLKRKQDKPQNPKQTKKITHPLKNPNRNPLLPIAVLFEFQEFTLFYMSYFYVSYYVNKSFPFQANFLTNIKRAQ